MKKAFLKLCLISIVLLYGKKSYSQVLDPGTISYTGGTITYGTSTGNFPETSPSGGTGSYSYQWEYSTDGGITWQPVSNADGGQNLDISANNLDQTTEYRRWTTSGSQSLVSNVITVPVAPQLMPGSLIYSGGILNPNTDPGNMYVAGANGGNCSGAYQYQLLKSADGGLTWGNASPVQNSSTFDPGPLSQTTLFKVAVSCGSEFYMTAPVSIPVYLPLNAGGISYPAIQIGYGEDPGDIPFITPPTGGTGSYTYQWQVTTDGGATWNNIPSATDPDYDPGPVNQSYQYRVVVNSGGQQAVTGPTLVAFYDRLIPGQIADGGTVPVGTDPGVILEIANNGPVAPDCNYQPNYQWQVSTDGTTWQNVPVGGDPLHDGIHEFYDPGILKQNMFYRREIFCDSHTAVTNKTLFTMGSTTLPVNFIDFKASRLNSYILLQWAASREINADRYVVERSSDAINFSEIGSVKANENSQEVQNYSFIDHSVSGDVAYFRIKEIDDNGTITYSAVRVIGHASSAFTISVNPNPFTDVINLYAGENSDQTVTIELYDYLGKKVFTRKRSLSKGMNNITINTAALTSGVYLVVVFAEYEKHEVRILKQ